LTPQIALVLGILVVSLALFVSERLRMDVVALMVLVTLALSGLLTPSQALSGFSNPAVITVWAMFMLSAGLTRTGVANAIGRWVLEAAGQGEVRLITVIMLTSGVLSAFMNNIGVAALLLPVEMDISRRTRRPPSRLLMPLAYGCLLGGLTTLIGTPPNLLVSEALRDAGRPAFRMFDFTPVGVGAMLAGIAFVALAGRFLLPSRDTTREFSARHSTSLREQYALHERSFAVRLPPSSRLVGRTLAESRLGSVAGLVVFAVERKGRMISAPDPDLALEPGDRLQVEGQPDRIRHLRAWRQLLVEEESIGLHRLVSGEIEIAELTVAGDSPWAGRTVRDCDLPGAFGVNLLAIRHNGEVTRTRLQDRFVRGGDRLLVQGRRRRLEAMKDAPEVSEAWPAGERDLDEVYGLRNVIFSVRIPSDSVLVGETLAASRLGGTLGLRVLGVVRGGRTELMPGRGEVLAADDVLLVEGDKDDLEVLRGLQELSIESLRPTDLDALETERVGLVEAILAPRSGLAGKTLREVHFRVKYGVQVLAISRGGRAYRTGFRDMPLRLGDALLLLGPRRRIRMLGEDPDVVVLTQAAQQVPRSRLAPVAAAIMLAVVIPVALGWLPIALAAVAGATLMVLTRCLPMEEAYRSIEWRSIFLIAGMLPLGIAMQETGAASWVAEKMLGISSPFGPWGVIASLYVITALATTIIPTAALVVLMAPIVLRSAAEMGFAPETAMMAVAMAASASFTSPISHPANVLVMGPGGYRFVDYVKLGLPLALVVGLAVFVLLPIFWPLAG